MTPPSSRERALVLAGFALLSAALTFPLALHPANLGYKIGFNDGQYSVWNVAWVARAIVRTPLHVFDANIFYPHHWTLAYSEANLGAGLLAAPVYWLTGSAYGAHNVVVLLSFVLSGVSMYTLARHLTANVAASSVAAIGFAFCPHVFAHLLHIQLLMTAGLPLSLLAFHRLADDPSPRRGIVLGLALALQAYLCAYYAIFAMLLVGYASLFIASSRGYWASARYWIALSIGAAVSIAVSSPLLAAYIVIRQTTGFTRSVEAAGSFAADWGAYLASSSYAHAWMLAFLPSWHEVLFPGFVVTIFGVAGLAGGLLARGPRRELTLLYGSIAALAFWESFGPRAGLYRFTYAVVPGFSFMRAPSRFGLLVTFALSVLAAIAIARIRERAPTFRWVAVVLATLAIGETVLPLDFTPIPPPEPAYARLATLPYGPVLELPIYSERVNFKRTEYMLASTVHWMPLVDAYSDYIPPDFIEAEDVLADFPTRESFKRLEPGHVRYAIFHVSEYRGAVGEELRARLQEFGPYLRRAYADDRIWIYEIVGFPP